jgi:prepilin peptidase CpaA
MDIGTPELVLVAGLSLLLLTTCVTDWRARDIPNWLTGAVALTAPLYWWATGAAFWPDITFNIGMAVIVFAVMAGLFALGWMGGGDVKLLTALALWIPVFDFQRLMIVMSVVGGIMTVGCVAGLWSLPASAGKRVSTRLAVLTAVFVITVLGLPYLGGGSPAGYATLLVWLPELEGQRIIISLVIVAMFIALGFLVGRGSGAKEGQLEFPYGLAIAFAGLCVVSQRYLNHFA